MDLAKLETLKQLLVEAREFMPVWDYFMTHFGEQRDFMELGEPARSPLLEELVRQAAREIVDPSATIGTLMLVRLPEQRFIHGAVTVQGKFGNIFYFEDVGVGLLAVVMTMDGDNRLIRFTAQTAPGGDLTRQ